MTKTFEDFPVYGKGLALIKEVERMCNKIKVGRYGFLIDQIRRASSSIILNIAEGSGKWNKKAKINFYRISQASAKECIAALDLFEIYKLCDIQTTERLKTQIREIINDLQMLLTNINKRPQ